MRFITARLGLEPLTFLNQREFVTGYYTASDLDCDPWRHMWISKSDYFEIVSKFAVTREDVIGGHYQSVYYFPEEMESSVEVIS